MLVGRFKSWSQRVCIINLKRHKIKQNKLFKMKVVIRKHNFWKGIATNLNVINPISLQLDGVNL